LEQETVRVLFAELDAGYFDSRLARAGFRVEMRNLDKVGLEYYAGPDGTLRATRIEGAAGGVCIQAARLILVDHHTAERLGPDLDPDLELRRTLLHEMVHAAVELNRPLRKGADEHGRRFVNELRRLVRAGERCLRDEVRFYSLSWLAREIMRAHARECRK
jgi:hypothetical protein